MERVAQGFLPISINFKGEKQEIGWPFGKASPAGYSIQEIEISYPCQQAQTLMPAEICTGHITVLQGWDEFALDDWRVCRKIRSQSQSALSSNNQSANPIPIVIGKIEKHFCIVFYLCFQTFRLVFQVINFRIQAPSLSLPLLLIPFLGPSS